MPRAAVVVAPGAPLELREISVPEPRAGEARVRLTASGVCHSDLNAYNAVSGFPLPLVLGHEGAGVVVSVGPGVESVAPGDHVVLSAIPQCGTCFYCRRGQPMLCERPTARAKAGDLDGEVRLGLDGGPLHQFCSTGTFAEEIVAPVISMVRIDPSIPLEPASLIGCAVATGVGAATRTAQVQQGDTVAVIGCGGVGLNVVQGARLAGAGRIVAVDLVPEKLELARRVGATHAVDARSEDPVAAVAALTEGRGADAAFVAIGVVAAMRQAIALVRPGGQCVLIGSPYGAEAPSLDPRTFMSSSSKVVQGCLYGSTHIHEDFPRLAQLFADGELLIEELISERISLEQVNDALRKLETGGPDARSVIVF